MKQKQKHKLAKLAKKQKHKAVAQSKLGTIQRHGEKGWRVQVRIGRNSLLGPTRRTQDGEEEKERALRKEVFSVMRAVAKAYATSAHPLCTLLPTHVSLKVGCFGATNFYRYLLLKSIYF